MANHRQECLSAQEMSALEREEMANGRAVGIELMERAARGVADAALAHFPDARKILILAGPGNNGGDGFAAARMLMAAGKAVETVFFGQRDKLPPDARVNYERIGRPFIDFNDAQKPDLVIDALFGTGLMRPIEGELRAVLEAVEAWQVPILAVDIPSGLCGNRGIELGHALRADVTVTFHSAKQGHYLAEGPDYCGTLEIIDIGLPHRGGVPIIEAPRNLAKTNGHKFSHGHALVLSGGFGKTGAARLAANAALRIGAGLVTIGAPKSAMSEIANQITALMLHEVEDAAALDGLLADDRINVICAGPGFGLERSELLRALLLSKRKLVLDADALTIFGSDQALLGLLHENCVLTPHLGEFARLCPKLHASLQDGEISKIEATIEAAKTLGATVLLKGRATVISDGKNAALHGACFGREAPWLSTAGAGDVLAGMITGLLARGWQPNEAASAATWLHVEAARCYGAGLIAEDLPLMLPKVIAEL